METNQKPQKESWARRSAHRAFSAVFFACLCALGLAAIFGKPEPGISEREQRRLTARPELTAEALRSGTYQEAYEAYLSDRMPGRDWLYSRCQEVRYFCGLRSFGSFLAGKDGSVLAVPEEWSEEKRAQLIAELLEFARKYPDSRQFVCIAPEAATVVPEWLPKGVTVVDQQEQYRQFFEALRAEAGKEADAPQIFCLDAAECLRKAEGVQLYYRSDHHWTTRGAYAVAERLISQMGFAPEEADYEWTVATEDFYGTTASGSGLYRKKDRIELCMPKDVQVVVQYVQEKTKAAGCFSKEGLEGAQPYEVFFGGNFGELVLQTNSYGKGTLLILKDSFANCLIPMLLPYYSKIVVVDPRYYNGEWELLFQSVSGCDVLWLFRQNTLAEMQLSILHTY